MFWALKVYDGVPASVEANAFGTDYKIAKCSGLKGPGTVEHALLHLPADSDAAVSTNQLFHSEALDKLIGHSTYNVDHATRWSTGIRKSSDQLTVQLAAVMLEDADIRSGFSSKRQLKRVVAPTVAFRGLRIVMTELVPWYRSLFIFLCSLSACPSFPYWRRTTVAVLKSFRVQHLTAITLRVSLLLGASQLIVRIVFRVH